MADSGEMLVLADRGVTDEFADRLGPDALDAFDDPFEALAAMGQGSWSSVVIAASYVGLDGLCRAVRRLQPDTRLLVLCGPGREPEVRELTDAAIAGSVIDDYYIYPLTNDEWCALAPSDKQ